MSQKEKRVDHIGKVQSITNSDVMVRILNHSACSACHVKGGCGMADTSEKIVVVHKPNHIYTVGQDVRVILRQSLGFRALFLGYVLPFILVLVTLIVLTSLNVSEGRAGLVSLVILLPYYSTLYAFRDRVSKQFTFDVESI